MRAKPKELSVYKSVKLQKKALKVIDFQSSDSQSGFLYQGIKLKVLKIADFINYKNALFVRIH